MFNQHSVLQKVLLNLSSVNIFYLNTNNHLRTDHFYFDIRKKVARYDYSFLNSLI